MAKARSAHSRVKSDIKHGFLQRRTLKEVFLQPAGGPEAAAGELSYKFRKV